MPISIPPIASEIALLLLFTTNPVERFVTKLRIDPVLPVYGIILAHFFVDTPYMIRILKVTFESINLKLEFVARTLGYNSWGAAIRGENVFLSSDNQDGGFINTFKGKVVEIINQGFINKVIVDIGIELKSCITEKNIKELGLNPGKEVLV